MLPGFALVGWLVLGADAASVTASHDARQELLLVLQLLERDYPESIEGGPGPDYPEQVLRAEQLGELGTQLGPGGALLQTELAQITDDVRHARPSNPVVARCVHLEQELVRAGGLAVAPEKTPDLDHGRALYVQGCAPCHGVNGSGAPAGLNLTPSPSNFWDADLMNNLSPLEAFNAVTFGVHGTAMPAFGDSLSESERWDVVAYVATLRLPPCNGVRPTFSDEELYRTTDQELVARYGEPALACARRPIVASRHWTPPLMVSAGLVICTLLAFVHRKAQSLKARPPSDT